jgi:type IV secretion system protein VirB10
MADKDNYFFPDFEERSEGAGKKVKNWPRSTRIIWIITLGLMVIICVVIFSMEDPNRERRQVSSDTSPPAAADIKPATGAFSDSEAIREIIYRNLREQIIQEVGAASEDRLAAPVPVAAAPAPKPARAPRVVRKPPSEQMENVRRMTEAAYSAPAAVELENVQAKKDGGRADTLRVPDEAADSLTGLMSAYLPQDQAAGASAASQSAPGAQTGTGTGSSAVSQTKPAEDSNASSMAHQDRANAYAAANTNTGAAAEYLSSSRRAPRSRYELAAGTIISGVMIGGINSDLPGTIVGQISEHVYDTATGAHILIPQGGRMVGAYDSHVVYGQNRLLVVWNRIIYPDGTSLNLEGMLGSDQRGYAGFKQKTDNHYSRMLGAAIFASVFVAAGKEATKDDTTTDEDGKTTESVFAEAVMENVTNAASQMLEKNMNIAPTLRILPGYRFSIITTRDVSFAEPYVVRGAPR